MKGHWTNGNKKKKNDIEKRKNRRKAKSAGKKWQERAETNWIETLRAEELRLKAERDAQEQALVGIVSAEEATISAAAAATKRQEQLLTAQVAAICEDYGDPIARIFKAAKACDASELSEGIVVVFNERIRYPVKLIGKKLIIGSAKTNRSMSVPYNPAIPA